MNLIALTALIAATSSLAQPANLYFDDIELRFEVGRYGMPGYFLKSMDFDARDETSEISMQYMGHAKDMYSPVRQFREIRRVFFKKIVNEC